MKRKAGVHINYLVGSMMLLFVRNLGPIPSFDSIPDLKVLETYNEMEKIRQQISETILDSIDSEEEEEVIRKET